MASSAFRRKNCENSKKLQPFEINVISFILKHRFRVLFFIIVVVHQCRIFFFQVREHVR